MSSKWEVVKEQITRAFKSVSYPGDDNLAASLHDQRDEDEITLHFRGRHWSNLPIDFLRGPGGATLLLLTPEAFRYYLPGYMIRAIEDDPKDLLTYVMGCISLDAQIPGLDLKHEQILEQTFYDKIRLLSDEQLRAVKLYLEYYRDTDSLRTNNSKKYYDIARSIMEMERVISERNKTP